MKREDEKRRREEVRNVRAFRRWELLQMWVTDGLLPATEKSDYIQAIGLSSAKFQHSLT